MFTPSQRPPELAEIQWADEAASSFTLRRCPTRICAPSLSLESLQLFRRRFFFHLRLGVIFSLLAPIMEKSELGEALIMPMLVPELRSTKDYRDAD